MFLATSYLRPSALSWKRRCLVNQSLLSYFSTFVTCFDFLQCIALVNCYCNSLNIWSWNTVLQTFLADRAICTMVGADLPFWPTVHDQGDAGVGRRAEEWGEAQTARPSTPTRHWLRTTFVAVFPCLKGWDSFRISISLLEMGNHLPQTLFSLKCLVRTSLTALIWQHHFLMCVEHLLWCILTQLVCFPECQLISACENGDHFGPSL